MLQKPARVNQNHALLDAMHPTLTVKSVTALRYLKQDVCLYRGFISARAGSQFTLVTSTESTQARQNTAMPGRTKRGGGGKRGS